MLASKAIQRYNCFYIKLYQSGWKAQVNPNCVTNNCQKSPGKTEGRTDLNLNNKFSLLVLTKSSPRKYARLHHPLRGILQV